MNNIIEDFPDKIYHGTIFENLNSIKTKIELDIGGKYVDFGRGFYTTTKYNQAVSFAELKAKAYNLRQRRKNKKINKDFYKFTKPLILVYNLDREKLMRLRGHVFMKPDREWSEFIYNNRLGSEYLISDFHNLNRKYDYVYGCLADASIALLIEDVKSGRVTYEKFCSLIKPYDMYNQDQLSFNSEKSLSCIKLKEYKII